MAVMTVWCVQVVDTSYSDSYSGNFLFSVIQATFVKAVLIVTANKGNTAHSVTLGKQQSKSSPQIKHWIECCFGCTVNKDSSQ